MKMWITYIQKANGLETASEARGSDLIRLGGHLILQFVSARVTLLWIVAAGSLNSLETVV